MHRSLIPPLLLLLLPAAVFAQREESAGKPAPAVSPAFGLHFGSPLRYSAAIGVIVDLDQRSKDGVLLVVEPGFHGAEAAVGYLRMIGRYGTGFSIRAAVLHTGADPWNANPHNTYVGAELQGMLIFAVGARGGLYRRAGGDPGSHDGIATVGLSLGI